MDIPKGINSNEYPSSAVQTRGKIQKASSAQQALPRFEEMQGNCPVQVSAVWILVDFLLERRPIGTKWPFSETKDDERSICYVRIKLDCSSSRHRQEEGIDYDEVKAKNPDGIFISQGQVMFQVTPKASHLHTVKRIFSYLKHQPKLGLWDPWDSPFKLETFSDSDYAETEYVTATRYRRQYSDKHNMVAFLRKPNESVGFAEVVDFLKRNITKVVCLVLVPKLVTRINSLEKELKDTKQTLGNDVLKLVKKVKTLETTLKRKSKKVLISESEAKTLSKVASWGVSKEKSTNKGKRYRRRARSMAKKIDTGLDDEEEINTGVEEINTGIEEVSTSSTKVDSGTASKREVAKQIHLDKMVAKRMAKEEALSEQQKKRKSQVQFEAQFYIEENWDAIRVKLEANAELSKDNQGTWKFSQLKKMKFEEIKEEFDKLTKTSKKQRIDDKDVPVIGEKVAEVKEEEQVKRTRKRKNQKARKGINVDKSATSVANWKIFQQGQRSVYQIIRANGADTVYMSFRAMIKDFTREDFIKFYRLVMQDDMETNRS
ncbi:hypothetical protein Tco_1320859 [Tanacetum coccineum]